MFFLLLLITHSVHASLKEVDWKAFEGLDLKTGLASTELKKMHRQQIKVLGYMVPLDFENKSVKEFLLIPYPMSCTHLPPPAPNQMVLVTMKKGPKKIEAESGPIYVTGLIKVPQKKIQFEAPSLEMEGQAVEIYHPLPHDKKLPHLN